MCKNCNHQYLSSSRLKRLPYVLYKNYCIGKQTLLELSQASGNSIKTIRNQFDKISIATNSDKAIFDEPINLILDATYFSRNDGVLVFRARGKNLHWKFIESETIANISNGLDILDKLGYRFKSVTIDGRRGVIKLFQARYPNIPIQLCQFHQTQIIRRYTTNNPKTECGKKLKIIMKCLTEVDYLVFKSLIETLYEEHEDFLKERNEQGQFKHRRLRSAFRSLKSNLPYLFTHKKYPKLNIPNTTNSCDGSFAHWKQKIKIHRGLSRQRRNKMINYLLDS